MSGEVTAEYDDDRGVCTLTIRNKGKRNAFSYEIIRSIGDEFEAISGSDTPIVVVLRGAGEKAFSSGFDLTIDRTEQTAEQKRLWPRMINAIESHEYPTIAMINGHTFGGAIEVIATCDLRIGVTGAQFGITPARLGITYKGDAIHRVMEIIGSAKTKEMLYTGEAITATHANEIGLLNYLVDRDELEPRTHEIARQIASNAPLSLKYMKQIIHTLQEKGAMSEAERDWVMRIRDECFSSHDHQEGVEAFNEGRDPVFIGE